MRIYDLCRLGARLTLIFLFLQDVHPVLVFLCVILEDDLDRGIMVTNRVYIKGQGGCCMWGEKLWSLGPH